MSLTLAHQSKIRSMYCSRQSLASQENSSPASEMGASMMQNSGSNNPSRPDSSSSTTSSADWESGLSTVRRQPPASSSLGKIPAPNQRKVEDISAFNAKTFGLHNNTLADARSRSRFKPPGGFAAGLKRQMALHPSIADDNEASGKTGSTRSGSLDTLDRLSVRSELAKPPSAFPAGPSAMQQQRRRHRSVERTLDDDADSVVCDGGDAAAAEVSSAHINERFSAAVFHHSKPGKLVMAKAAAAAATRTLHKSGPARPLMNQRPVENCPSDHELDGSSVIYSLRPGEPELAGGVQLSHNAGSRSIQDHIIATQMNRLNREMPISDVYHERNMGLGLAPPLSELLVNTSGPNGPNSVAAAATGSGSVASSEDVFNSFDQISLADTITELSDKTDSSGLNKSVGYAKRPPPRPSKLQQHFGSSSWASGAGAFHATGPRLQQQHRISVFDTSSPEADMSTSSATMTLRHGILDMTRRDEADGRSMTDSNYSGYSPHRNLKLSTAMPHQQQQHSNIGRVAESSGKDNKSNTIHAVAIIESDARANDVA